MSGDGIELAEGHLEGGRILEQRDRRVQFLRHVAGDRGPVAPCGRGPSYAYAKSMFVCGGVVVDPFWFRIVWVRALRRMLWMRSYSNVWTYVSVFPGERWSEYIEAERNCSQRKRWSRSCWRTAASGEYRRTTPPPRAIST